MNYVSAAICVMALVTFVIRVVPLTLIRGQVRNRFACSFLFYVPYVTLAVMTVPGIIDASQSPAAGTAALAAGILLALNGSGLFTVSLVCCAAVFILELFLI